MLKSKLRKVTVILTIIMLMTLTLGLVAACGENPSDSVTSYKVTFYDGTTVIVTETVEEGKKVEEFEPADKGYSKKGYTFNGWFATSDFTHDWSFDTAITKDTNVYSQWQSSKQDTRQWTIAGSSSAGGSLAEIGWNGGPIAGKNILTKTEGKNEFKITLNLYKGDQFQFCIQDAEGNWNTNDAEGGGARGGQYLEENEYMAAPGTGLGDGQVNITVTIDRSDYIWYIYGNSKATTTTESVLSGTNWGAEVDKLQYSPYEMFKISDNEADGTGTWMQTWTLAEGDEFLLAYCTLKEEGGIRAEDGTMFYYTNITEFNGDNACFKKSDGMGSNIVVVKGGTYTFTLTVTLDATTNTLKGAIEVDKTSDILVSDQTWKVLGGRLSYTDATKETVGNLKIEESAYNSKTSVFKDNNFGVGSTVQKLGKGATPTEGMAQEYTITLNLVEGDYFYLCIPVAVHAPYRPDTYYTPGYTSKLAKAADLTEGITDTWGWGGNFLCTKAGSYTFKVSVSTSGALSLSVTAATK